MTTPKKRSRITEESSDGDGSDSDLFEVVDEPQSQNGIFNFFAKVPKASEQSEEDESVRRPAQKAEHCSDGKQYLARYCLLREIFDDYLVLANKSDSNFTAQCFCCETKRSGSAAKILPHFSEGKCPMSDVPEQQHSKLKEVLVQKASARIARYERSSTKAKETRLPSEVQIEARQTMATWAQGNKTRQDYLQQRVSKLFVACNLPASLAENPFFRDFIVDMTGGKISDTDAEAALKRRAVTNQMDEYAQAKTKEAEMIWTNKASTYGGTLLVDGWTAARLVGTIGVALTSLTSCYVLPLIISGVARSRAEDYEEKLETILPWKNISFCCTDGASNMVLFGNNLQASRHILPTLCSAHGFSLIVHYIGKVFENRTRMFSKVAGIISFFNRSTQRLSRLRDEEGSGIGFIKFCKTRMAYQTLALLRVIRLRSSARKALITILDAKLEDDEDIDVFSTTHQVDASLKDDRLFKEMEIFCRITLPVVIAMREVDRGTPMAGFVYWLHYHVESQVDQILEKLEGADLSFRKLRKEVLSAIRVVWDKRHRPVLSLAYLTNPLFHGDLSKDADVYALDDNFASDVEEVFCCMTRKRYEDVTYSDEDEESVTEEFIIRKAMEARNELDLYLRPEGLGPQQYTQAKVMLASDFWRGSALVLKRFPNLAWYARRIHSMAVVTSGLERFFSQVGCVQTEKRASLDSTRAGIFASAHQQLLKDRNESHDKDLPARLLGLVKRCEDLQTETSVFDFTNTPEFDDLESWIGRIKAGNAEALYGAARNEGESDEDIHPAPDDQVNNQTTLLNTLDDEFDDRDTFGQVRRSKRERRATVKLNI